RTSWGAVTLLVLTPFESFEGKKPNEQNKGTIVARLSYNNFSVLLTGDCEFELEDRLMAHTSDIYPLTSTILKVGHHGSAGSTSEKFLQAVDPKIAVISVGAKNRYGHPTKRVLDLLEQYKIPFYRTDEKGRIEIESDGDDYQCVAC
ncbi:MBL fold protein, partial [Candidatus Berkelbacteria bacterium CG10_big_fil_rev_8_21_14_0_10_43_14]